MLTAVPAAADSLALEGPFAGDIPVGPDNLVLRARDLLRHRFPERAIRPVAIGLAKNLPPASGLGGGSSDAAAALRALDRLWELGLPTGELSRLALELGADLPMCLLRRPAVARGIGEALEPFDTFPPLPIALVNPGVPVPTAAVFRALADKHNPPLPAMPTPLGAGRLAEWLAGARNDLEAPALAIAPQIGEALAELRASGALLARMSGSGATCFGLYESIGAAELAATHIAARRPGWFARATTTGA